MTGELFWKIFSFLVMSLLITGTLILQAKMLQVGYDWVRYGRRLRGRSRWE